MDAHFDLKITNAHHCSTENSETQMPKFNNNDEKKK